MNDMSELLHKIQRKAFEPKIYSLVVRANRIAILHMGIYYSLDEAFAAVKLRAIEETKSKDDTRLILELLMWEIMPVNSVLLGFFGNFQEQTVSLDQLPLAEPLPATLTATEYAKQVYGMKNELMKRIIEGKDVAALDEAKSILSKSELKLIRDKITIDEKKDDLVP